MYLTEVAKCTEWSRSGSTTFATERKRLNKKLLAQDEDDVNRLLDNDGITRKELIPTGQAVNVVFYDGALKSMGLAKAS